jgi:4-aminobutyrate aminotransferase-like enzyme
MRTSDSPVLQHSAEPLANAQRYLAATVQPRSLRTYTPTQAVIAQSAGVFYWCVDGKRLLDFTSGVLVANLGHHPVGWLNHFHRLLGWLPPGDSPIDDYHKAVPLTAYNAFTPLDVQASAELCKLLQGCRGGGRLQQVLWAASGSEAIQKALWAAMAHDPTRPMILATRHGYHGKKGLSCAVTGCESDAERDPRVRFVSFPQAACRDVTQRADMYDPASALQELQALWQQFGRRIGTFITEPYLGGGGSYHPPLGYLQAVQRFCREHDILFILDEVQSNFGRTRNLFAYETYGLEPDIVVLGKGLGNGVPVSAAVGRADVLSSMTYGEASDTWSANPLQCAAVLATLKVFRENSILPHVHDVSRLLEAGLVSLKQYPGVVAVRGEHEGMVWGVEFATPEQANRFVLAAYHGTNHPSGDGVHLLGPLAKKVVRIAPPLVITTEQSEAAIAILHHAAEVSATHEPTQLGTA